MSKREILDQTVQKLERLPLDRLTEVANFTDFLLQKLEGQLLSRALTTLNTESAAFDFLKDDDDLYSIADLKDRYQ